MLVFMLLVFFMSYFFKEGKNYSGYGIKAPSHLMYLLMYFLEKLYMDIDLMVSHTILYPFLANPLMKV